MAESKRAGEGAKRGHLSAPSSSISSRQGSVDGNMQRCGLCSMLSRLVRRAMCVGSSRRGSGESYYQELADTTVSINLSTCVSFFGRLKFINFCFSMLKLISKIDSTFFCKHFLIEDENENENENKLHAYISIRNA